MNYKTLSIILIIVIVILIGIAVYLIIPSQPVNNLNNGNLANLNNLQNDIIINPDERILLIPDQFNNYRPIGESNLQEILNNNPATLQVTYTNRERGLTFKIPYNPLWGSENYRINPYDEIALGNEEFLEFGSIGVAEGGGWGRTYFLKFLPVQNFSQVVEVIEKNNQPEFITVQPTQININGLTVVEYEITGLCEFPTLIILGEKYNYELRKPCNGEFAELEEIVKTITLID